MLFNMIFKTIKAKPARAVLTIISIVIGVTSVLLINTVSSAGTEVISNELNSLGIDCISIGPALYDVHTVNEKLSISSTENVFNILLKILENMQ